MDQNVLVENGRKLVELMGQTSLDPRAAVWVNDKQTDRWRLWIVPKESSIDKREFYRRVAELVNERRDELGSLDVGNVELVQDSHPAIKGLSKIIRMEKPGAARFQDNMLNGFFLPDGIVLKMAL